jgi:uncharacterized protein YfaA (DUF2138 family)
MLRMVVSPRITVKPDYIIRLEHMTEDLLKLPFIFDVLTENKFVFYPITKNLAIRN